MVNEGRITTGRPSSATLARTSSIDWQTRDRGVSPPARATMSLNSCRSSPRRIASMLAPISSTPYLSRTPLECSATAVFRAVCPPSVGRMASGRSRAITSSTNSGVIGSTYVASANSGSVMIVAGLELTRETRRPSARSTRQAWVPE
jgi:hypothetical protein